MDCQEKWTGHWKKAAKEGGISLLLFPEEPLYYILWKPFMQMEDYI